MRIIVLLMLLPILSHFITLLKIIDSEIVQGRETTMDALRNNVSRQEKANICMPIVDLKDRLFQVKSKI